MAPPTKRRKRNVLPSSGDSSGGEESCVTELKRQTVDLISSSPSSSHEKPNIITKPQHSQTNSAHNPTAMYQYKQSRGNPNARGVSSSPEKRKRTPKLDEKDKSRDISTLFSQQAQRQAENKRNALASHTRVSAEKSFEDIDDEADLVSDDDEVYISLAQSASTVGLAAKKRARGSQTFKNDDRHIPSMSPKFRKNSAISSPPKPIEAHKPWAERFAPTNLEELAVHKRKVSDVRSWLEDVTERRLRQRVLLLKGPAGTGKTATIHLLADAMGIEVLEWRNPIGSVATSDGFQSIAAQFDEFMGRGGKFGQLEIFSENMESPVGKDETPPGRRKRLILIEEFPNTFAKSSTALQAFRSAIIEYLASNTPPLSITFQQHTKESVTPVILVVSEALLTTSSSSADSFTAHRLLGPEILQHPGVGTIEFNPIAPTILAKALDVIVQKESRKSGRRKTPGPGVLQKLGEVGDIRSAIGSLEFLCLRGDIDGDWGAKVSFGKTKKSKPNVALTRMEVQTLELVTRREASLGIFHAVGKVVYNKRLLAHPATEHVESLPDFMALQRRPMRPEVSVDTLIDETGTDTPTFIAALHENYILSCEAPPTSFDFSTLDHITGCIDSLSDSDLLSPSWDGSFTSAGNGVGTGSRGGDSLRLDEYSFHTAVRGLLFSLPNPVIRRTATGGKNGSDKRGTEHKMFYPTSLKLWRAKEEIESAIDLWVTRFLKNHGDCTRSITTSAAAFSGTNIGIVESWKSSRDTPATTNAENNANIAPLMSVGASARKEMLLERLPYMVLIAKGRSVSNLAAGIKDMEKVTNFSGSESPLVNESGEVEETNVAGEFWATDEEKVPRKRCMVVRGRDATAGRSLATDEQKLVLSDDDIED